MSDDIKGVLVRFPLSDWQKRLVKLSYSGSMNSDVGFSKACLAIGTPVMDGELPTEVVRVREHRKDIELPWTYHKAPTSDQDASEYELEFDRLVTHKQVIAKLAEKNDEIARLQANQPHYDRMVQENGELKLVVARLQAQDDKEITQVIEERDEREQVIDDLYQAVMGDSPEWSNNFGYRDAVEDVVDYVHALRTKALKGPEA